MKTVSAPSLDRSTGADPYHLYKLRHPYHLKRARMLLDGRIPPPSTIEIDVTDGACNQACVHCCFGSGPHRALRSIDPDQLLAFLEEAYANGTRAFELVGGGEPTNHPRIGEIVERIHGLAAIGAEQARTVCKHFRADAALDEIEDAAANGHPATAIEAGTIDNPHFI